MTGLDDLNLAMRMRDTIQRMVREELNRVRPPEQYGRAISVNRMALTAFVLLNGDSDPIRVKMSSQVQPRETDEVDGVGNGCTVLVGGTSGNYWIKSIISGHAYSDGLAVSGLQIFNGVQSIALNQTVEALLPAIGSVYHIGRWDNTGSVNQDGKGYLWISVRQDLFSSLMKTYQVSLKVNGTNGVWQKLASSTDHGVASGNDLEMEIMADNTGFELRVRRTKDGGGFTPGTYLVSLWAHMDSIVYDPTNVGESAATAPTRMYGTVVPGDDNGPYISPGLNYNNRGQMNLVGGGTIGLNRTTNIFSWSERFLVFGQGRNQYSPAGSHEIIQPANGTAIPVFGSLLATSVTATSAGIPLQSNQTLYYEPPWGDALTAVATNFRIVAHDDTASVFVVPSHWIMIGTRADSLAISGGGRAGNGERLNGPQWQTWSPSFHAVSGFALGNGTVYARYRQEGATVFFQTTLTWGSTTNGGSGQTLFNLPVPSLNGGTLRCIGSGVVTTSAGSQPAALNLVNATEVNVVVGTGVVSATVPATWTTGNTLRLMGMYECDPA
jgi:hypothetical protein